MEQLNNFWEWYIGLFSDTDNRVKLTAWTATIATITFTITFLIKPSRQYILKKLGVKRKKVEEKATSLPVIEIKMNENQDLLPMSDKEFKSKIVLARQIFRSHKTKGIVIKIIPTFSIKKLDDFHKRTLDIQLQELSKELEIQFEILLSKHIEISIEHPDNLLKVINSLIETQNPNVTGKTKIELYRTHEPKINFPIWLTTSEMEELAKANNTTVAKLISDLRIPTLLTPSIFTQDILHQEVIPAMVREIYRIHTRFKFDISKPHWETISLYEVGLG